MGWQAFKAYFVARELRLGSVQMCICVSVYTIHLFVCVSVCIQPSQSNGEREYFSNDKQVNKIIQAGKKTYGDGPLKRGDGWKFGRRMKERNL